MSYGVLTATVRVAVFPYLRLAAPRSGAPSSDVAAELHRQQSDLARHSGVQGFALTPGTAACMVVVGGPLAWPVVTLGEVAGGGD